MGHKLRHVSTARARRRRIAAAGAGGLAIAAFAFGAVLGDRDAPRPQPSPASLLSPRQLVGERLVAGFPGAGVPTALRRMIRQGELAGVILFEANLPSREAARRLVSELE